MTKDQRHPPDDTGAGRTEAVTDHDREMDALLSDLDDFVAAEENASASTMPASAPKRAAAVSVVPPQVPAHVFPDVFNAYVADDEDGDLFRELEDLVRSRNAHRGLVPYSTIRDLYCELQIAANVTGLRPPSLRPVRKRPPKVKGPEWDTLARDNMVIDLHWLHCRGFRRRINDSEFADMMTDNDFDISAAQRFVRKNWTTDKRVLRMGLTELEQSQLVTLVRNDVRKNVKTLLDAGEVVEAKLRDVAQRRSKLNEDDAVDFARLWLAEQIAGAASHDVIAMIHGWTRGKRPITRPTLSSKLKRMRIWLEKAGM